MTLEYPGHFLKTRRHVLVQSLVLALLLLPVLGWRFTIEPMRVSMALAALTLVPFALIYRGWRVLDKQERLHTEPTPEMMFVFETVAVMPLSMSA